MYSRNFGEEEALRIPPDYSGSAFAPQDNDEDPAIHIEEMQQSAEPESKQEAPVAPAGACPAKRRLPFSLPFRLPFFSSGGDFSEELLIIAMILLVMMGGEEDDPTVLILILLLLIR